jgi:hypothetical protein
MKSLSLCSVMPSSDPAGKRNDIVYAGYHGSGAAPKFGSHGSRTVQRHLPRGAVTRSAGVGDFLLFVGYGAGATFAQIGSTDQWQLTYNGGASQEIITFANSAPIDPSDYAFI